VRGRVFIAAEGKQQKKYIFNDLIDNRKWAAEKLKETSGAKVFRKGYKKAVELLNKCEEGG